MNNRNRAIIWVVAIFLAGGLFGATLAIIAINTYADQTHGRHLSADFKRDGKQHGQRFLDDLSRQLQLDLQQVSQLQEILERSRTQHEEAMEASRKRSREIRKQTREEILTILRPEQAQKFEDFLEAHRERLRKRSGNDKD